MEGRFWEERPGNHAKAVTEATTGCVILRGDRIKAGGDAGAGPEVFLSAFHGRDLRRDSECENGCTWALSFIADLLGEERRTMYSNTLEYLTSCLDPWP